MTDYGGGPSIPRNETNGDPIPMIERPEGAGRNDDVVRIQCPECRYQFSIGLHLLRQRDGAVVCPCCSEPGQVDLAETVKRGPVA